MLRTVASPEKLGVVTTVSSCTEGRFHLLPRESRAQEGIDVKKNDVNMFSIVEHTLGWLH